MPIRPRCLMFEKICTESIRCRKDRTTRFSASSAMYPVLDEDSRHWWRIYLLKP